MMVFHPNSLPNLTGKVFVVTGGNSGIGYHTVAHLAQHGAHVYMGARNVPKGEEAVKRIKEACPNAHVDLLHMDLADFSSIVAAAKVLLNAETELHGLVNNGGIMATPFEVTRDGHEAQWQTNYLSHWLFTEHLLPTMLRTSKTLAPGSVRIVNLTSSGHLGAPKNGINFQDLTLEQSSPWARYGQSKLANILHTSTLHAKYGPGSPSAIAGKGEIWLTSVHPGLVETNLGTAAKERGWGLLSLLPVLRLFHLVWPAEKGSWNSLFCAASQDMKAEQSGTYMEVFGRFLEPYWLSSTAKDAKLAEELDIWTTETMRNGHLLP